MKFEDYVMTKLSASITTLRGLHKVIDESFREYNAQVKDEKTILDEVFKVLNKFQSEGLFYFETNPKLNPSLKDWYKIKPETWNQNIIIRNI